MATKSAKLTPPNRWQELLPALILALLVIVAYLPALHGQFIWDDDFHVVKSMPLRSLGGLCRIWFKLGATQQYYPMVHSSFWIDYHLWGLNPLPYHAENILLHTINAILVWRILRRLNVTGAWLGAALFALHPVCVESVAWISERKNTLSGLFFLLSLSMAIEFWLPRRAAPGGKAGGSAEVSETAFGPWKFYGLALLLYVCALWSKTATVGLPGVILILAWWKRGRVVWKDWALVLPFLALGLGLGLVTVSIENHFILNGADIAEWKIPFAGKFIIAGRALWFYLGKLFWPHPLMFVYPRWVLNVSQPLAYLPLAAAGVVFALLWSKRRSRARPALAAVGYFVVMLFPALGFFNIFPFRYSFVADHFQYLATIGPLALAGAGITVASRRFAAKNKLREVSLGGAILLVLGMLTWQQTHIYRNLETLWRDSLAHNPGAWMAEDNLGLYLTGTGRFQEADTHYEKAVAMRPNDHIAYYDMGLEAAIQGNLEQAVEDFNKTLELCPTFAMAHYEIGNVMARNGNLYGAMGEYREALQGMPNLALAHFNLANALARSGKPDEAMEEYRQTLESQPDYAPAHTSIGRILAAKGKVDEAINEYRDALEIDPNSVEAQANLGNAMVSKGRFDDAVTCYRAALQLDPNSPVIHFDLSVALTRLGDAEGARSELSEAKRLQAEHPVAGK